MTFALLPAEGSDIDLDRRRILTTRRRPTGVIGRRYPVTGVTGYASNLGSLAAVEAVGFPFPRLLSRPTLG